MLSLYRRALALRRQLAALGDGTMAWLDVGPDVLAFRRRPGFACVVNVGDEDLTLSDDLVGDADIVLASAPLGDDGRTIPGATAIWLQAP